MKKILIGGMIFHLSGYQKPVHETLPAALTTEVSNRPLADKKRQEVADQPSSQIDTDAGSTRKGGTYYLAIKAISGWTPSPN